MLKKKNRADINSLNSLFKKGKFVVSPSLIFRYLKNNDKAIKISFIAPKNVAKLAVKRNLLRRRGYLALEKYFKLFPAGITGVFAFKKYQDDILIIKNEIKYILNKIN